MMDFRLSDVQTDIKRAAREFAEGEFPKVAQECDRNEKMEMGLLKKARDLGFVGIWIDEKYGGMGLGFLETALVMEEFWRVDPGLGSQIMCMPFGSEVVSLFGTETQKERYLNRVCEQRKIGYIDEYDISRFYRDAKIVEIYEGVKDVEKLVIGRHLVKGQVSF
jgi:alkylation response protein AidB-like acyl-CoA dehydrogenase